MKASHRDMMLWNLDQSGDVCFFDLQHAFSVKLFFFEKIALKFEA